MDKAEVAVIVGRFQTSHLTNGHRELIDYVLEQKHNLVLIILGKTPMGIPTKRNPLDVDARNRMIEETYLGSDLIKDTQVMVTWIEDIPGSDQQWSERLDKVISDVAGNRNVVVYGSRDSFIDHYHGKYNTCEYKQKVFTSASEVRQALGKEIRNSEAWRAGVVWATQNQFDKVLPTVDVAILDKRDGEFNLVLGKKKIYDGYMFIGGFADPTKDISFEETARREVLEETKLQLGDDFRYLGSFKVDDYRYRNEIDKIITSFFLVDVLSGNAIASDDIDSIHTVKLDHLKEEDFATVHRPLFNVLMNYIRQHKEIR